MSDDELVQWLMELKWVCELELKDNIKTQERREPAKAGENVGKSTMRARTTTEHDGNESPQEVTAVKEDSQVQRRGGVKSKKKKRARATKEDSDDDGPQEVTAVMETRVRQGGGVGSKKRARKTEEDSDAEYVPDAY